MRNLLIACMLWGAFAGLCADPINCAAPQFLQPMFDAYTMNYPNAVAVGRGHTGTSDMGGLENALMNPAAFSLAGPAFSLELLLKTHADPIPEVEDFNVSGTDVYTNPIPLSFFAIGFNPAKNSSMAITYSIPQSVYHDAVALELKTGSTVERYPSLIDHRLTLSGNTHFNNGLSIGLAAMLDLIHQNDYRSYFNQLDQISTNDYLFRFQPGLHYQKGNLAFGLTDLLPVQHDFDMSYGEEYDVTFPNVLNGGVSVKTGSWKCLFEAQYEQWSTLSDDFDNRLRLSAGFEHKMRKNTVRFGCMSVPGVYDGEFYLPNPPADPDTYFPGYAAPEANSFGEYIGSITENDQFFLTVGVTAPVRGGAWNLALASDVLNKVQVNHFMLNYTLEFARLSEMLQSKPKDKDIDE